MALPLIAIPVFWLLSLEGAIIVYLFCLLLSGAMFWLMRITHRIPVATGAESLINRDAEVISKSNAGARPTYLVRMEGELWTASSNDTIKIGETVTVSTVKGNMLKVKSKNDNVK